VLSGDHKVKQYPLSGVACASWHRPWDEATNMAGIGKRPVDSNTGIFIGLSHIRPVTVHNIQYTIS
jgi:hypothetical protein